MFVRLCSDYADVIRALRDRTAELQISMVAIDSIAGLSDGYAAKLLSLSPAKVLGPISMGPTLETLGLRLMLVEDTAATARTLAHRDPVDRSNQRFGNKNNSRPQLKIESSVEIPRIAAPPRNEPVSRAHLRVIQDRRRGSKWG